MGIRYANCGQWVLRMPELLSGRKRAMYEKIFEIVQSVDDFVWGWWMIILLLGTHLFMTVRTGFIQRKSITKGIPLCVKRG